ncbi:MAG: sodium:solute symporter family protein [Acidobacteriota bacterium]
MSPESTALGIIVAIVAAGSAIGLYAGGRRKMDLEQWTVAGRGFGLVFVWLLMAGEVYTTFAFLGAAGWAYSRGGPALYILAYMVLGYVLSFYFLPQLWEAGRRHGMQTEPDYFLRRYGCKYLAGFVALAGFLFMIPYVQLQLTGLGIILEVASFGRIGRAPGMAIAVAVVVAFVLARGVRAVAWVSVLKDALMLAAAVAIGIGVPYKFFGGIGPMFDALARARPAHLVMPGSTATMGHAWFVSTVLLTSCGFYMWPHTFASAFTARSANILRRNAVIMPLYTITLPLIFFAGFAALLAVPGLSNGDLALLTVVRKAFPPWFLGLVGGAGALTAMVPAALLLLTAATLFAKNFCRPVFAPAMTDAQVARLAKLMVVVVSAAALYFAVYSSTTLVGLLLIGYAGVTQFFPGVLLGLYWPRATRTGIFAGMIAGVALAAGLMLGGRDPICGVNAGFFALCVNAVLAVSISRFGPDPNKGDS